MDKIIDYFFCVVLFFALFLPTNDIFVVESLQVTFKAILFVFLAIINLFGVQKNQFQVKKSLRILCFLFIGFSIITELIIKPIYFYESISNGFKSFYLGIPMFLGLTLILFNLRIDIRMIWKTLCFTILVSIVISIVALFVNLPIGNNGSELEDFGIAINGGRIFNANASFGIIAFVIIMRYNGTWISNSLFQKTIYITAIIATLLTFNRTYMGLLFLMYVITFIQNFSWKNVIKNLMILSILIGSVTYFYNKNEIIRNQVNERILYLFNENIKSNDRLFENNRDMIYDGIRKNIEDDYWVIGLPFSKPIFYQWIIKANAQYTDTSFVNILLRFGIVPLILYLLILVYLYKTSNSPLFRFTFVFLVLASLNIDVLYRHNGIFFIVILYFVSLMKKIDHENTLSNK